VPPPFLKLLGILALGKNAVFGYMFIILNCLEDIEIFGCAGLLGYYGYGRVKSLFPNIRDCSLITIVSVLFVVHAWLLVFGSKRACFNV
jgi:hypothetical protein